MERYRIVLNSWEPEPIIEGNGKKAQRLRMDSGGVVRVAEYKSDEQAIESARGMWKDYFDGKMKEVRIYNSKNEEIKLTVNNNFKNFK